MYSYVCKYPHPFLVKYLVEKIGIAVDTLASSYRFSGLCSKSGSVSLSEMFYKLMVHVIFSLNQ